MTTLSVYRFKFTDDFVTLLSNFSKLHQYDTRETYNDAWKEWLQENTDAVNSEFERLTQLGYTGDIKNKMYKAARYYFRTKPAVKQEPAKRRNYISIDRDVLDAMDEHILTNMRNNTFTPAEGYNSFCLTNQDVVKEEVLRMFNAGLSKDDITNKVKKTYKNRYFIISRNNSFVFE